MPCGPSDQTPNSRQALVHAVIAECLSRRAAGEAVSDESVIADHPGLMPDLGEELARFGAIDHGRTTRSAETTEVAPPSPGSDSPDLIPPATGSSGS